MAAPVREKWRSRLPCDTREPLSLGRKSGLRVVSHTTVYGASSHWSLIPPSRTFPACFWDCKVSPASAPLSGHVSHCGLGWKPRGLWLLPLAACCVRLSSRPAGSAFRVRAAGFALPFCRPAQAQRLPAPGLLVCPAAAFCLKQAGRPTPSQLTPSPRESPLR